jgi:hypothetical protein
LKLQTQIPLQARNNNLIDYNSNIVLLGSCFAESIGDKLGYFKFRSTQNPFGILFHPIAIENSIHFAIDKKEFSDEDVFLHNELWHCFDAHSKRSSLFKTKLLESLNESVASSSQQINQASHIIITLGTAWVYKFEDLKIVANCHKIPQNKFKKELLSIEEISKSLKRISEKIHLVNPKAAIIFTVSPVRHLKDGFIENTLSKAHLIAAVHQVVNEEEGLFYFPSYELMMDELRDYRFYKEDMIHPNQMAINYIWEKFIKVWISASSKEIMNHVEFVQKGLLHKPFNPEAKAHLQFLKLLEEKQMALKSQYSHIEF